MFSVVDILGIDPEDIVLRLDRWGLDVSVNLVSRGLDILFVLGCFIACFFIWRATTRERRQYIREKLGASFDKRFNSRDCRRLFIDTSYQDSPLVHFDQPDQESQAKNKNLIRAFLDLLGKDNCPQLHLVFGGSGMGKSSFLVALLRRYVMRNPKGRRKFEIQLVDLGRNDCLDVIARIEKKPVTILLLDALDENRDAENDCNKFILDLENIIQEFPFTIITCRTQFFPSIELEPQQASIISLGKFKDPLQYRRYYVCYFTNADVRKFLRRKYPIAFIKYHKAKRAISLCKGLEHRPLLLSYIDDLIKNKETHLRNELDLYECLIKLWIRREEASLTKMGLREVESQLMLFSQRLALKMYEDYEEKNDYYVSSHEADEIWKEMGETVPNISFRSRSLIERDASGNYKFAHRTFLEFFLARYTFREEETPIKFKSLNMTQLFFAQMCYNHISEQVSKKAIAFCKSEPLSTNNDQMDILSLRLGLKLKSLYALPEIKVLSVNCKDLSMVLDYIDGTEIRYLRILEYRKDEPLNSVLDHPQIKYLWIEGADCAKLFLKKARKQEVSVILNGELVCFYENDDCPFAFSASARLVEGTSSSMVLSYFDSIDK